MLQMLQAYYNVTPQILINMSIPGKGQLFPGKVEEMSDFAIPVTESEEDASSGMKNKRINHLCPDLVFHQAPDLAFCTFTDLERWDCNCCE